MGKKDSETPKKNTGQSLRLGIQHELAGGPVGIFGKEAKRHDLSIRNVMKLIFVSLKNSNPALSFRHRNEIPKQEINRRMQEIDSSLGKVLFVQNSNIKPDGGVIEVLDNKGKCRIILGPNP